MPMAGLKVTTNEHAAECDETKTPQLPADAPLLLDNEYVYATTAHPDFNSKLSVKRINDPAIIVTPIKSESVHLLRQFVVSFGSICGSIAAGMTSGYSAVLLPQLQSNTSELRISEETATWIASTAVLPMALGCLAGGILMERFGRKTTHLILSIPFVIGWAMIGFANNLPLLLAGRLISGACVGVLGPPGSVMIGEISTPKYRGILLAGVPLAIAVGILISHILGTYLHWKTTALICSIFPMICFFILAQVPESPSWLIVNGRLSDAEKSFQWYRGTRTSAAAEFQDLMDKQMTLKGPKKSQWANLGKEMKNPAFVKPLVIILIFFFIMQFSGVNAVAFYSVTLMQKTLGVGGLDKYMATILIDAVRLSMSVMACVLLRRVGRRGLAIFSAIGTAFSLFGLTLYLHLSKKGIMPSMPLLPLILLIAYICSISIGIVPLPWCMIAELFPLSSRGIGSGLSAAFNFLVFFIVVQTGPSFFRNIGTEGAFLIYGSVAFIGAFFLYFHLPETKNRTLQQIEDSFTQPKNHVDIK